MKIIASFFVGLGMIRKAAVSVGIALVAVLPAAADSGLLDSSIRSDMAERARVLHDLRPTSFLSSIRPPAQSSVFGQCVTWNGVAYSLSSSMTPDEAESFVSSLPPLGNRRYVWSGQVWESTATNGPVSVPGERITLTWSFVPDGTWIIGPDLFTYQQSTLFSTMNAGFGNQTYWMNLVRQSFADWGDVIGVDYVEVSDDGADLGEPGVLGVRGDIRIGMISIDTLGGILAYNFFPLPDDFEGPVPPGTGGDMVIDSQDILLWSTELGDDFMTLRNTVRHEHGHGMGFNHVDPLNETKLMEALLTTGFDGPQEDDIRAGQRFYGDWLESNSTLAEAAELGMLPDEVTAPSIVLENLAVETPDKSDYFRFEVPELALLKYRLEPVGTEYLSGTQGGLVFPLDALRVNNLAFDLLSGDGSTVYASVDDALIGVAESGSFPLSPGAGEYLLRVRSGTDNDDIQRYEIELAFETGSPTPKWEPQPARISDFAGNRNGSFDPGEAGVVLRVPIRNIGFSTGSGLVGTLESLTPTVTVTAGFVDYGTARPGETLIPANVFVLNVDSTHVCGDPVILNLWAGSEDHQFEQILSFPTGRLGVGSPVSYVPLLPRPINPVVGDLAVSRIAVADEMIVGNVRLTGINITYPQMQDLLIYLQSPNGTYITLSFNGFSGPNLVNTTLSDSATTSISQGLSPYTGEFLPEGSLSEFIGESALGFWDFGVYNLTGSSSGTISTWTLEISPVGGLQCDDVPAPLLLETLTIY